MTKKSILAVALSVASAASIAHNAFGQSTQAPATFPHRADVYEYNVNRIEQHKTMTYNHIRREVQVPEIPGYKTLKGDFHIHTVFSDGDVWPTARVDEAWREGLDVIAITDHTSAQPSKKNVTGGPNSSYEIAKGTAEDLGIMLIQGTEISRGKEKGGHMNALFISDAEKTLSPDTNIAVDEAIKQGAYIIWNHPGWDIDTCVMFEPNIRWIKEGKIKAVEVFNEAEWYPRALSWTKDYNLAPIATTDIHALNEGQYRTSESRLRPMTLLFVQDESLDGVREALESRRTLALFNGMVAGSADLLKPFFQAAVQARRVGGNDKSDRYQLINDTDVPFELIFGHEMVLLPARSSVLREVPKGAVTLPVRVNNLHTYEYEVLNTEIKL